MWPFRKREAKVDRITETINELKAFRDIGETFNYLGRTCIVTGHFSIDYECGVMPCLLFDYVDDYGVIRNAKAHIRELPGLIKQQVINDGKAQA